MIEISAKLYRGSVYFVNEQLKCLITYRNVGSEVETLAWSGAQIHCHSSLDETKVLFNSHKEIEDGPLSSTDTSFHPCNGEKGHLVLSTKPKILFCDLNLHPNESKTFLYEELIPSNCPPSFYGSWVKYMYKLTIGTQRVNCVIQLLRMPLRVITLSLDCSSEDNNFIEYIKEPTLDIMLHKLDCLTGKRNLSSFKISNQLGKVARFSLLKRTFKLGEDIVGYFDFSKATVPCVQFSVTLQSEETLKDEFKVRSDRSTHVASYSIYHEFCLHLTNTQMILPIPLTITPDFQTNLMKLSWKLHFEFVTTVSNELEGLRIDDTHGIMEQSPSDLCVQTMIWDLPINLHPTHPLQIGRALQMPATMSIRV